MASVGAVGCFALNAASYIPFIWVALWVLPRGKSAAVDGDPPEDNSISDGLGNIIRDVSLRSALLTVLLTSLLCRPLIVFCPVLVKTVLHGRSRYLQHIDRGLWHQRAAWLDRAPGRRCQPGSKAHQFVARPMLRCPFGVRGIRSMVLGIAVPAGVRGLRDDREQHICEFTAAGLMSAGATRANSELYMLAMRGGVSLGNLLTGLSVSLIGVCDALFDRRTPRDCGTSGGGSPLDCLAGDRPGGAVNRGGNFLGAERWYERSARLGGLYVSV
jgi:hypothetical protein